MKNIFAYYLALLLPFGALIFGAKMIPSWVLLTLLVVWALLYAPWLSGLRLYQKGIIPKKKLVQPTSDWTLFKEVHFRW